MHKAPSQVSLIVLSYLPMATLFVLIALIYSVYTATYLIDIISDNYTYVSQVSTDDKPTVLIMMHTLTTYSRSLTEKLSSVAQLGATPTQQKGIVFGVIIHILLAAFFIATYRVVHTGAGSVPDNWNNETEKELSKAVEVEKRVLRNIRRQVKRRKQEEEECKLLEKEQESHKQEESGTDPQITLTQSEYKVTSQNNPLIIVEEEGGSENENSIKRQYSGQAGVQGQGQGGPSKPQAEAEGVKTDIGQAEFPDGEDLEAGGLSSDKIHQLAVVSALKRSNKRFCSHCQKFKPERAHHCRQCGECVLKMDHHCPWVGNCVGFYNYKYFMNMIFFAVLLLLFVVVTYAEAIGDIIFDPKVSSFLVYLTLVTYILTVLLTIILTCFFIFHLWLVYTGKTTLEFCEKKPLVKYNFGGYQNLQRVFGKNVFIWIFPFNPYTEGEGVVFN